MRAGFTGPDGFDTRVTIVAIAQDPVAENSDIGRIVVVAPPPPVPEVGEDDMADLLDKVDTPVIQIFKSRGGLQLMIGDDPPAEGSTIYYTLNNTNPTKGDVGTLTYNSSNRPFIPCVPAHPRWHHRVSHATLAASDRGRSALLAAARYCVAPWTWPWPWAWAWGHVRALI